MPETFRVRLMAVGDMEAVATLCGQLGYPSTPEQVGHRFGRIQHDTEAALFVAQAASGKIVGWVYVRGVRLMEADGCAQIWGLVVDADGRGQGAGKGLMQRAEEWARGQGYTEITLHSNVVRTAAHAFYQRQGYEIAKSSYLLRKTLTPGPVSS